MATAGQRPGVAGLERRRRRRHLQRQAQHHQRRPLHRCAATGLTQRSYTDTGLTNGTTYHYVVSGVSSGGQEGPNSAQASATPAVSTGPTTFVARGATWKYLDNGTNQGTAWRATSFNDSTWASGPAELGYGDGDEATMVSYGPIQQQQVHHHLLPPDLHGDATPPATPACRSPSAATTGR